MNMDILDQTRKENIDNVGEFQDTLDQPSPLRKSVEKRIKTILHQIDSNIDTLQTDFDEKTQFLNSKKNMIFDVFNAFENERQNIQFDLENKKQERHEFQKMADYIIDQFNRISAGEDIDFFDMKKAYQKFEIECDRLKTNLPIYAYKSRIIELVEKNQISVVVADTGSGKTTQISQYLLDADIITSGFRLVCTQPRKIAAMSAACRISEELGVKVGDLVGYKAGTDSKWSQNTKILFMTDHTLLNECLENDTLDQYSCIIIDEAHERSIYTDLLLGIIKNTLPVRKDLRVLITSATIDPQLFVRFFQPNLCPVLKIPGRLHPVEVIYSDDPPKDDTFFNLAIDRAMDLHCNSTVDAGGILVFLTTPSETEDACKIMQNRIEGLSINKPCLCLPLHGRLDIDDQQRVFDEPDEGTRKVVFATNSAETSITIPNISMVIDSGYVKEATYDPKRNLDILSVTLITQSAADQRKGRAGRTRSGKCYRLYDKSTYTDTMKSGSSPEILRVNLGLAFLKLYSLGVDPQNFDFVESPERSMIDDTINMLKSIGAVDSYSITELGLWISKLPLTPYFSVFIHEAIEHNVGLEAVVISAIASLSGNSLFYHANASKDSLEKQKLEFNIMKFTHLNGDIFTYLNVFRDWIQCPDKNDILYCVENTLNWKNLMLVKNTTREILHLLSNEFGTNIPLKFENSSVETDKLVHKLLFKTFRHNLCHYLGRDSAGYLIINSEQRVHLFSSSSLKCLGAMPEWIFFLSTIQTYRTHAIIVQPVDDNDVLSAISEDWLEKTVLDVKEKVLQLAIDTTVGSSVFSQFVGPCFRKMLSLEAKFQSFCRKNEVVVIEAIREMGSIKVFTSDPTQILSICNDVSLIISHLSENALSEIMEHDIGGKTRAVALSGALISTILYHDENIRLLVFGPPQIVSQCSKRDVEEEFQKYGSIKSCIKFEKTNKPVIMWGSITFDDPRSAQTALQKSQNAKQNTRLVVKLDKTVSESSNLKRRFEFDFSMEFAFGTNGKIALVEFSDISSVKKALDQQSITCGTPKCSINIHKMKNPEKQSSSVIISDFHPSMSESRLSRLLCTSLSLSADDIKSVNFQIHPTEFVKTLETRFVRTCNQKFTKGTYCITVEANKKCPSVSINGRFQKVSDGWEAFCSIKNEHLLPLQFDCSPASFTWSIFLPTRHYDVVSQALNEILSQFTTKSQQQYDLQSLHSSFKLIIIITSASQNVLDSFWEVKSSIESLTYIDELNCAHSEYLHYLFGKRGRVILDRIEAQTSTWILTDMKFIHLKVHGTIQNRIAAFNEIHKFQDEVAQRQIQHIDLKADGMPSGLAKRLVVSYGMNLEEFIENSGLFNCEIDLKSHSLVMIGDNDSFVRALTIIQQEMTSIKPRDLSAPMLNMSLANDNEDLLQECSACLCPIDASISYRLESCGHPYCLFCIVEYIHVSQKDKAFPLVCSKEGCGVHYALADLKAMEKMGFISLKDLMCASIEQFVAKYRHQYRFCCRPGCFYVFRITRYSQKVQCLVCLLPQCSGCGAAPFHERMSCEKYETVRNPRKSLENWLKKNPQNRKCCPNCSIPIEKLMGCNHVACRMCGKHICWQCLKFFDHDDECYGHLMRVHGNIN